MKHIAIAFIKIYRYFISPLLPSSCKFHPTCSEYALICFRNMGVIRALYFTIIRILKCNPWSNGGIDIPKK